MTIPTNKGAVYFQEGGAGRKPRFVTTADNATVAAPSGGGVSHESLYAGTRYKSSRRTSNPERVTAQIQVREDVASEVQRAIRRAACTINAHVFRGCDPTSKSVTSGNLIILVDSGINSPAFSANILDGVSGDNPDLMRQLTADAGAMVEVNPVAHADAKGTVTTGAINHVLAIDPTGGCAGACGSGSDGLEALAVGDPVSPATIPRIFYTPDGGVTWVQQTIAAVANGAAEQVAVVGDRVIVAVSGTNGGVFTAPLADVKLGTATFTLASGITAGHVYNAVVAVDAQTAVAVGASGRIAVTTDGGYTFTLLSSPTSNALNAVAVGDDRTVVWAGGASGTVVRIRNLSSAQTVTISGIVTDAVNAIAVPYDRSDEVYVGTATGEIHRSLNAKDTTPVWAELSFDKPSGGGIIEDIKFSDARQSVMWVVQTDSSSDSRVIRDVSGGFMTDFATAIGTFSSPANNTINAIAPFWANYALTVGEPQSSQGFIGIIQ